MPLRMDTPLPSLDGGTDWFNSEPVKDEDLKGKPVLVHFWSVSCGTCKESLPDINRWLETYKPDGLQIISVHMPRQESDTKIELVKEAMAEWEVQQPVVVDNWHEITNKFENKYVPAYYLFDEEHKMRDFKAGEKAVKMVEPAIERILKAQKEKVAD